MKHTKGPWVLKEGEYNNHLIHAAENKIWVIAETYTYPDTKQEPANARLISAAPELLDALYVALEGLEQVEDPLIETSDALIAVRKAIAKSEGGEK